MDNNGPETSETSDLPETYFVENLDEEKKAAAGGHTLAIIQAEARNSQNPDAAAKLREIEERYAPKIHWVLEQDVLEHARTEIEHHARSEER